MTAALFYSAGGTTQKISEAAQTASLKQLVADVVKILFTGGDVAKLVARQILQILGVVGFVQSCLQRGVFLPLRGKLILQTGLLGLRGLDSVLHAEKLNAHDGQK